jgi:hypothetical protein
MSVVNVVCQPQCAIVLTDGATYSADGIIRGLGQKVFTATSWPGLVAGRGTAIATVILGQALSWRFSTFDQAVAGVQNALPELVALYGLDQSDELILAGWSEDRSQAESYVIYTGDDLPEGMDEDDLDKLVQAGGIRPPAAFELIKLPAVVAGPLLGAEITEASGYRGINANDDYEKVISGLRLLIECQRHDNFIGDGGKHLVGGFAQLTTVWPDKIEQRILHRWPDVIGELINPGPIDWTAFRESLDRAIPDGLSRLQRDRMRKKLAKGTLRAA